MRAAKAEYDDETIVLPGSVIILLITHPTDHTLACIPLKVLRCLNGVLSSLRSEISYRAKLYRLPGRLAGARPILKTTTLVPATRGIPSRLVPVPT